MALPVTPRPCRGRAESRRRGYIAALFAWAWCLVLPPGLGAAQDETTLAKETQNPIPNRTSLPLLLNFFSGGELAENTRLLIYFQPVFPVRLHHDWNLMVRTVMPFENTPVKDDGRERGLGNLEEQFFFTNAHPGAFVWGLGPAMTLPTATNAALATGQWGLGPDLVLALTLERWVLTLLANNQWKIAGSDASPKLNELTLQPGLNFNVAHGWSIASSPQISANWTAKKSEQWTVPVGLGVAKALAIRHHALTLSLQYYRNVVYPEGTGANQLRLAFTLLFPNVLLKL